MFSPQRRSVSAFADAVRAHPNRPALSETDWCCTYSELDVVTDKAASAFLRLGLEPQDRVLFQLPNSKERHLKGIELIRTFASAASLCQNASIVHCKVSVLQLGRQRYPTAARRRGGGLRLLEERKPSHDHSHSSHLPLAVA
ncbi:AMP-binding protein [Bradyrhizobium elkanii]|uniref:AMP-binding protein n=1 Tax=Bradyrhizobium elkanii TaxID=29448 RepID=UPI003510E88D